MSEHSSPSNEARYRAALEAIANAEIPGVSGGPHGASAEVMAFAQQALRESQSRAPTSTGRERLLVRILIGDGAAPRATTGRHLYEEREALGGDDA